MASSSVVYSAGLSGIFGIDQHAAGHHGPYWCQRQPHISILVHNSSSSPWERCAHAPSVLRSASHAQLLEPRASTFLAARLVMVLGVLRSCGLLLRKPSIMFVVPPSSQSLSLAKARVPILYHLCALAAPGGTTHSSRQDGHHARSSFQQAPDITAMQPGLGEACQQATNACGCQRTGGRRKQRAAAVSA